MKKTLLATTALAALGAVAVAGPAMAAEKIKLSVGGYMEQWFGYGSSDVADENDRSGFDQQSDSEIFFSGKTTLDNGLTVGVNVQLEGESSTDEIDEAYAFVQGSFGEFGMGSENGPAYKMHFGLASHGAGIDEGDGPNWIAGLNSALNRSSTSAGIDNDNNKIWYISPRVLGIQVGISFDPNDAQDSDVAPN
jgi:opacity protein-like surface antigen